jgi:hypothetical protein
MCLLFATCAALAQTTQSSLIKLNGLKAGQKIQVVETNSKKDTGTFEAVSDAAISIRDAAGEKSVPMAEVRSVKLVGTHRRLRNTLIGLGIGAGGGAAIGAAIGPSNGFIVGKGVAAAIVGTAGAVFGTVVGVLLPTHETVYATAPH